MRRYLLLAAVLSSGCASVASWNSVWDEEDLLARRVETEWPNLDARTREERIRTYCRNGNVKALCAIHHNTAPLSPKEITKLLRPHDAVKFCNLLWVRSLWVAGMGNVDWHDAFLGLSVHPCEDVIGYVIEMSKSEWPAVRCACYEVCREADWPYLIVQARKDVDSTAVIKTPNSGTIRVADEARRYLAKCDKANGIVAD